MKCFIALTLSAFLLGCSASKEKEPDLSKVPPDVAAHLKTPEGQEIIANAKKYQAEITQKKLRLFHQTDHAALLKECRLVIANRRALERSNYGPEQSFISGSNSNLPPAIKSLPANHIHATDKKLKIELGGGFHHYGIVAFTDGDIYEPPSDENSKKLVEGLWFYEDAR
jgi:hypothetical protein